MHAGVATHYCESAKIPDLEKALLATKNSNEVDGVINELCPKPKSEFILSKHLDQINNTFTGSTMEEILDNLEKDNSEWAMKTIKVYIQIVLLISSVRQFDCLHVNWFIFTRHFARCRRQV